MTNVHKIPLSIVSGFLGAGKTTFIKKLVREVYSQEKVVVLENEFGKIDLDSDNLSRERIFVPGEILIRPMKPETDAGEDRLRICVIGLCLNSGKMRNALTTEVHL